MLGHSWSHSIACLRNIKPEKTTTSTPAGSSRKGKDKKDKDKKDKSVGKKTAKGKKTNEYSDVAETDSSKAPARKSKKAKRSK